MEVSCPLSIETLNYPRMGNQSKRGIEWREGFREWGFRCGFTFLSGGFNSLFGTQTWNETENQKRLSYWRFWVPLLVTLQHKWKWIKCVR